jgi:UDP-N-acetylglucosamine:LPS N-acetylglucosamine transferase
MKLGDKMDKSNKYLFTIRSLTGGGAERVVSVLASGMARAGYDISVIAYDKTVHDYRMDPAVKIYYMPKPRGGVLGKINRISDMKKIITQINPDVVIPFVGTVLFVTYLASRHLRCSFVRTVRISPWQEQQSRLHGLALKYINNKANCIMVQNSEQSTYFSKKLQNKIMWSLTQSMKYLFLHINKNTLISL